MVKMIVADLPVLAVNALQVAVCEEDVADPVVAAHRRLLPPVDADGADAEPGACLAPSGRRNQAVGMAFARTEGTVCEF